MKKLDDSIYIYENADELQLSLQTKHQPCPGSTEQNPHDMRFITSEIGKPEFYCPKCSISIPLFSYTQQPMSRLKEAVDKFRGHQNPEPQNN